MAPISEAQEIALIAMTFAPSVLSIAGSSTIIYLTTCKTQRSTVYTRLLLGMSVMDCLNTSSWLLQPFLLPESGGRVWAVGNDQTCQVMGFFFQLGTSTTLYTAALALYFWLTIVFQVREETFSDNRRIEVFMHAVPIVYPLVTAMVGAGIGIYREKELGMVCWIGEFPDGCVDDPDSFCLNVPIGWVFSGIPYFLTLIFMVVANTMIYYKVRRTFRKTMGNRMRFTVRTLRVKTQSGTSSTSESSSVVRGTPNSPDEVKIRDVGIQSLLYVGAGITMGIWFVFLRMKEGILLGPTSRAEEASVYWLLMVVQLTCPTQGFFNALIFIRPKYIRWRRRHPDHSRWRCLRQALKPSSSTLGSDDVPSPPQEQPGLVASVLPSEAESSVKVDSTHVSALRLEDDHGVSVDTGDSSGSSSAMARKSDEKTVHVHLSLAKEGDGATAARIDDNLYSAARLPDEDTCTLPLEDSII